MGRPINKRNFGATGGAPSTIPVRADIDGTDFEGFIVRQRGSKTFNVSNDGGTKVGDCNLVNKITGHDNGECSIVGIKDDGNAVAIQKITAHKAVDYAGVIYSWATADDSAESLLRLTAL
mgnify:FL=1